MSAASENRNRAPEGASVRCPAMAADTAPNEVADGRVPDFDPQAIEARWQQRWREDGTYEVDNDDPRPHVLRALHVPVPERVRRTWATCATTPSAT